MNDLFNEQETLPRQKISIEDQIAAVNREIVLRDAVYAKMIANGKMSRVKAQKQIAEMEAVRNTLAWVREHRELIADVVRHKTQGDWPLNI